MNPFQTLRDHRRLADQLRRLPKDEISPARRAVMRDQVVLAAQARSSVAPAVPAWPKPGSFRFAFAAVAAFSILFLVTSTVITAEAAGPGDTLYGLNQALDQVHFAVTLSSQGRADVAAAIAEKRQAELEKVQQKTSTTSAIQAQAQTNADDALDRAIVAVGKVKTHSDKNRAAIQNRAAQKVQHLIELRDKQRAKRAAQDANKDTDLDAVTPTPAGNSEKVPPGQDLHSPSDDASEAHGQNSR